MDYSRLSVILIQAFKEQQQIIEKQQSSIESLTEDNKSMKLQLQKIEVLQSELDKIKASLGSTVNK